MTVTILINNAKYTKCWFLLHSFTLGKKSENVPHFE